MRQLPSVDRLVNQLGAGDLPRPVVVEEVRRAIDDARRSLAGGVAVDPTVEAAAALEAVARSRPTRVINATGVLLHTNLGRAPLAEEAVAAAVASWRGYGNVELDLAAGDRGSRAGYLRRLVSIACGSEAALVVNNNAGGLLLVLMALAAGRPVPVGRGELIEIGGSYRLPELCRAAGARLVEVGTTNRTRLADYQAALTTGPALILKVHPSNYRIEGFAEETPLDSLVALGRDAGVPVVFDAGSGLLDDTTPWLADGPPSWLAGEPGIRQAVTAGADLVLFSGDKLLGGAQAGIIAGRADLVDRLARHPAARALRIDGATDAALAVTFEAYLTGRASDLPLWTMATLPYAELEARARAVVAASGLESAIGSSASTLGAGSAPGASIPSPVIEVGGDDLAFARLLAHRPPVLARRQAGRLLIDLRAVDPADDLLVAKALAEACR
jgi:L-seryl-tRNA(Ser) seleniumtransferase